jgi:quinol-cytochrome oxidoreductase complex cytochrome b subunit
VSSEAKVVLGISVVAIVIGLIGLFSPVGLGEPADSMNTPAHVKPEWYFLGLYQLLKYISKTAGAVLPILGVLLITFWPFLDRKTDTSRRSYRKRAIGVAIFMIVLIGMTIWAEVN